MFPPNTVPTKDFWTCQLALSILHTLTHSLSSWSTPILPLRFSSCFWCLLWHLFSQAISTTCTRSTWSIWSGRRSLLQTAAATAVPLPGMATASRRRGTSSTCTGAWAPAVMRVRASLRCFDWRLHWTWLQGSFVYSQTCWRGSSERGVAHSEKYSTHLPWCMPDFISRLLQCWIRQTLLDAGVLLQPVCLDKTAPKPFLACGKMSCKKQEQEYLLTSDLKV